MFRTTHFSHSKYLVVLLMSLAMARASAQNTDLNSHRNFILDSFAYFSYNIQLEKCNYEINASRNANNETSLAFWNEIKGFVCFDTLSLDLAKQYFEKTLYYGYKSNNYYFIELGLRDLGKTYYRMGNNRTSIKYFLLLNDYAKRANDSETLWKSYYYLNSNYADLGQFHLAIYSAKQANKYATIAQSEQGIVFSCIAVGNQFLGLGQLDSCETYYEYAAAALGPDSDSSLILQVGNCFAKLYMERKEFGKAVDFYKVAITTNQNPIDQFIYVDNLAFCFLGLNQPDSAIYYFKKAAALTTQYSMDTYKVQVLEIANLYQEKGNADSSNVYLRAYINAVEKDNTDNGQLLDSLRINFEMERNKISFEADKRRIQELYNQKRQYNVILAAVVFLMLLIIFYIIYQRIKNQKAKEKHQLMLKVKDAEIRALQTQMNPHFIFNAINAVLDFIQKSRNELASSYLVKFSRLIRMVLENSNKPSISLTDELTILKTYTDLENVRFGNSFEFEISIDPELDTDNTEIPSMILQPFIENAIIHGIQLKRKISENDGIPFMGKITLQLKKEGDFIVAIVEDNGMGIEKSKELQKNKIVQHKSLGMRITKDRISLLNENSGNFTCEEIIVNGQVAGTKVVLKITLVETL